MMPRRSALSVADRIKLIGSAVMAVTHILIVGLSWKSVHEYEHITASWWLPVGVSLVGASTVAVLIGVALRRVPVVEAGAVFSVVAYVVALGSWFVGWTGESTSVPLGSPDLPVWTVLPPMLGGSVLIMCGCLRRGVLGIGAAGGLSVAVGVTADAGSRWAAGGIAVWVMAMCGVYLLIMWSLVVGAQRLDDARSATARDAVSRLRSTVHDVQQRRLDAVVHDRLIALLLSLRPGVVRPGAAAAAANVLAELDDLADGGESVPERWSGVDVAARMRSLVHDLGETVDVTVNDESAEYRYPSAVVESIVDATGEAVRNYSRHAGPSASCAVVAALRPGAITVAVVDDGIGFDVGEVSENRIGLALGIVERMRQLDGGASRVVSVPGDGVHIDLSWQSSDGAVVE